jgi:hypothetical protein
MSNKSKKISVDDYFDDYLKGKRYPDDSSVVIVENNGSSNSSPLPDLSSSSFSSLGDCITGCISLIKINQNESARILHIAILNEMRSP